MAIGSGLAAQLGIAEESQYGTGVTVTRFYPFESEGLKLDIARDELDGLLGQGTTVLRSDRWAAGAKKASGTIKLPVLNKSFGLWFKHMLGTSGAITTPSGGTTTRDQTYAFDNLLGRSLTVQVGRPDAAGTVQPFTYSGCKVADWEFSNSVKGFLGLSLGILGADETTATGLAAASYTASMSPLHWAGGSVTVAGTSFPLSDFSLKGANGLSDDRYVLGSQTMREGVLEKLRELSGELTADFADLTAYARFVSGSTAAIVAKWEGATIEGSLKYGLTLTMPVCRFDGETPNVDGPKRLQQKLPFKVLSDGAQEALTLTYRTTDTAA